MDAHLTLYCLSSNTEELDEHFSGEGAQDYSDGYLFKGENDSKTMRIRYGSFPVDSYTPPKGVIYLARFGGTDESPAHMVASDGYRVADVLADPGSWEPLEPIRYDADPRYPFAYSERMTRFLQVFAAISPVLFSDKGAPAEP